MVALFFTPYSWLGGVVDPLLSEMAPPPPAEVSIAAPSEELGEHPEALPTPQQGQQEGEAGAGHPRLVWVLGGPGAGKMTLCERLVDELHAEYGVVHFSSGALLRHAVESGHDDSAEIERAMVRGEPVRDAIVVQEMLKAIDPEHAPEGRCVLLEGFPGSTLQAQMLQETVGKPDAVLLCQCPEDEMIERVLERGRTRGRKDDQNMSVLSRISSFNRFIVDLTDTYRDIIKPVDTSGTREEAYAQFNHAFRTLKSVQSTRASRKLLKSRSLRIKTDSEIRALWDELDEDGSGTMEMVEIQRLSHRLHMPLTHTELVEAMRIMDSDGSGTVEYEEFKAWWQDFSHRHDIQVHKHQQQAGGRQSPSQSLDEIEFKVWLSRHGLEDFSRTFQAEGHTNLQSLLGLGGEPCARLLWSMGVPQELAMALLEELDKRSVALSGLGDDFTRAADWERFQIELDLTPEEKEELRKEKERARRRAIRQARKKAAETVPHFMHPNLAAMLPEFVNQGAQNAAAIWGVAGAGTGTATTLQDHKWSRHSKAMATDTTRPRPMSLPDLTGGPKQRREWEERWKGNCSMPPGGKEWRSPGPQTNGGSLPCRRARLVVLANLKRTQLLKLCKEAGISTNRKSTSADMVAALTAFETKNGGSLSPVGTATATSFLSIDEAASLSTEQSKNGTRGGTVSCRGGSQQPGHKRLHLPSITDSGAGDRSPRDGDDLGATNGRSIALGSTNGSFGMLSEDLEQPLDAAVPLPASIAGHKLTRKQKRALRLAKRNKAQDQINILAKDPSTNPVRVVKARRGSGGMYGLGALASSHEVTSTTKAVGDLLHREFESELTRRKREYLQRRHKQLMKVKPWMVQKDEEEAARKRYSMLVDSSSIDVVGQVQHDLSVRLCVSLCSSRLAELFAFASLCAGGDPGGT
eukprot:COSAG02_NODE_420_length_22610_cov_22.488694_13_plen_919_part_00